MTPDAARRLLTEADKIHSAESIDAAITRVAAEISGALAHANPLVLCVMRGGTVFAGHLMTQLPFALEFDYADVTRYGDATSGGALQWRYLPETNASGRDVLLLDDILDEGITLAALRDKLMAAGARRVWTAVLIDKVTGRAKSIGADFTGLTAPDRYVFGFGMDAHGYWRNLPAIYALKDSGQ